MIQEINEGVIEKFVKKTTGESIIAPKKMMAITRKKKMIFLIKVFLDFDLGCSEIERLSECVSVLKKDWSLLFRSDIFVFKSKFLLYVKKR